MRYEYKVIPAPTRGLRGKGVKGADGKFAHAIEHLMNDLGQQGWEYQRADTLPSEERAGLTSKTTTFRNLLIFRRSVDTPQEPLADEPKLIEAQEIEAETPEAQDDFDETETAQADLETAETSSTSR